MERSAEREKLVVGTLAERCWGQDEECRGIKQKYFKKVIKTTQKVGHQCNFVSRR